MFSLFTHVLDSHQHVVYWFKTPTSNALCPAIVDEAADFDTAKHLATDILAIVVRGVVDVAIPVRAECGGQ